MTVKRKFFSMITDLTPDMYKATDLMLQKIDERHEDGFESNAYTLREIPKMEPRVNMDSLPNIDETIQKIDEFEDDFDDTFSDKFSTRDINGIRRRLEENYSPGVKCFISHVEDIKLIGFIFEEYKFYLDFVIEQLEPYYTYFETQAKQALDTIMQFIEIHNKFQFSLDITSVIDDSDFYKVYEDLVAQRDQTVILIEQFSDKNISASNIQIPKHHTPVIRRTSVQKIIDAIKSEEEK